MSEYRMNPQQQREPQRLTAGRDDAGRRLDRIVRRAFPSLSLSLLHRLMRTGAIRLNETRCTAASRVAEGDVITVRLPAEDVAMHTAPQAGGTADAGENRDGRSEPLIEGRILLENEHILAVHKRRGTLVHGEGSLAESVSRYLSESLPPSLSFSPGPLHRLDRNSSGVILFGKSIEGARRFSQLLRERTVIKRYVAVLSGALRGDASWDQAIARDHRAMRSTAGERGDDALTRVRSLAHGKDHRGAPLTLALCEIHSGRTHQIRAHAAEAGTPLAGDAKYGGGSILGGYVLHALSIELLEPDPILGFRVLVDPVEQATQERIERWFGPDGQRAVRTVAQIGGKRLHSPP